MGKIDDRMNARWQWQKLVTEAGTTAEAKTAVEIGSAAVIQWQSIS